MPDRGQPQPITGMTSSNALFGCPDHADGGLQAVTVRPFPPRLLLAAELGQRRGTGGLGADNDQVHDHLRDHEDPGRMTCDGAVPLAI